GVEPSGRHNDGCFIAVFKVSAFRDLATFKQEVTEFAQYLKATPLAQGFTEVFYPGEVEFKKEQDRRKNGVPIEDATWNKIRDLAQGYGLTDKLGL
ncbi:MAG TPA: Ldh family oxidoreductase, partial [Bradyrhizobium sp.]